MVITPVKTPPPPRTLRRVLNTTLLLLLAGVPACATGSGQVPPVQPGAADPTAPTATLTVNLDGFRKPEGLVRVAVYSGPDGFLSNDEKAVIRTLADVKPADNQVVFQLPAGQYAVAVLHDQNASGKIETNILGIPKEGVSTSNNPRPRFRAPSFEESRFDLPEEGKTIAITLHYY
jgi:uncharacterized protein (DUF2141 family)